MNSNTNNIDQTVYDFKAEELNKCTKEELVQGIIEFGNKVVNNRIADLIACLKSQPQDPSSIDITSEEFNKVFQHDKVRFDLGINKSTMLNIQRCLNKSKTVTMEKQGLYKSASDIYHSACIKQYSLLMIEDSMKKAINSQAALDTQKDQLRLATMALKKQQQQIRLERASISMDGWQQTNTRPTLGTSSHVEVVDSDDGDDGGDLYNNGVDTYMDEN